MNKKRWFLLILALVAISIPVRGIDNIKGDVRFISDCPNCGDSWYWKESGVLTYRQNSDNSSSGVMICQECLDNPAGLHVNRIAFMLWWPPGLGISWEAENIELVKQAVRQYKADNASDNG